MPSEQSTWLLSAPQDGDAEGIVEELTNKIQQHTRSFPRKNISEFGIPTFKVHIMSTALKTRRTYAEM